MVVWIAAEWRLIDYGVFTKSGVVWTSLGSVAILQRIWWFTEWLRCSRWRYGYNADNTNGTCTWYSRDYHSSWFLVGGWRRHLGLPRLKLRYMIRSFLLLLGTFALWIQRNMMCRICFIMWILEPITGSDAGIFNDTDLKAALKMVQLDYLNLTLTQRRKSITHVLVGNGAFARNTWIMKPLPINNTSNQEMIFNYTIFKTRRVVKMPLVFLASTFRFFLPTMLQERSEPQKNRYHLNLPAVFVNRRIRCGSLQISLLTFLGFTRFTHCIKPHRWEQRVRCAWTCSFISYPAVGQIIQTCIQYDN